MGKLTPLLRRTLRPFVLYALLVLGASIPVYYVLVDRIWLRELDEHNRLLADRTQHELNGDPEAGRSIDPRHYPNQPGTTLEAYRGPVLPSDSTYTIRRQNPYVSYPDENRYRGLRRTLRVGNQLYRLTVETNVEETEETVLAIALVTVAFFGLLVVGLLLLTQRLSVRLWQPFRQTLAQLQAFNLDRQTPIAFSPSDTAEFAELNQALTQLIDHSIAVYRSQREFIQNASHELQTPLAIATNKLDLLLQQEGLTEAHYQLIEAAHRSLTRISRLNRHLLLLSRLEHGGYADEEALEVGGVLGQSLDLLTDHADQRALRLRTELTQPVWVRANKALLEVLLTNLLVNALRYTPPGGEVLVRLQAGELRVANPGTTALQASGLFERFARVSAEQVGSGLGLAIARQVCERYGWSIHYTFDARLHHFWVNFSGTQPYP